MIYRFRANRPVWKPHQEITNKRQAKTKWGVNVKQLICGLILSVVTTSGTLFAEETSIESKVLSFESDGYDITADQSLPWATQPMPGFENDEREVESYTARTGSGDSLKQYNITVIRSKDQTIKSVEQLEAWAKKIFEKGDSVWLPATHPEQDDVGYIEIYRAALGKEDGEDVILLLRAIAFGSQVVLATEVGARVGDYDGPDIWTFLDAVKVTPIADPNQDPGEDPGADPFAE